MRINPMVRARNVIVYVFRTITGTITGTVTETATEDVETDGVKEATETDGRIWMGSGTAATTGTFGSGSHWRQCFTYSL
jgi:hypothetical protein